MTRGYKTTESCFEKGFRSTVYVSDCWFAQLKTPAANHQLCLAHLLRCVYFSIRASRVLACLGSEK